MKTLNDTEEKLANFNLNNDNEDDNDDDDGDNNNNNNNNNNLINGNKVKSHLPFRSKLPTAMMDRSQISIWSILKQFIGKELSKIAMPAAWCEPLSFLQRITENVCYSQLLDKASDQIDPCKRMEYIAAYAVSSISSNVDRLSKPFNPLLGETFELIRDDLGFRIICEQVSHHPPISAFHVDPTRETNKWKYYGTVYPKIKFWGKSIEVHPKGLLVLDLLKHKETYTWQTVTCCIHNIIVGKLWFEYYGTMEIVCKESGYKAVLNFKPYSWTNRDLHKVEGFIYDNKKNKIKALYGYWTHCFYSCDVKTYEDYLKVHKEMPTIHIDQCFRPNKLANAATTARGLSSFDDKTSDNNCNNNSDTNIRHNHSDSEFVYYNNNNNNCSNGNDESYKNASTSLPVDTSALVNSCELWRANPMPEYATQYYNFNYFSMCLNELKPEYEGLIAPTDSRYRSDIRSLENGDLDGASREKQRLEEKQRESRKNRKDEWKPRWFYLAKSPINGEEMWLFTNKYWSRDFKDCPSLY